ncbi:pimeloyl-ACP methyl ester carboxylesterase [Stackebrandtia endophytica]|uniref:Pimeloyl-ACP methyl ester carboxylesterase n=1 Tax=Stackebrandtia endophytica TaxID=1496996 RepID=A0A543AVL9_9ACTN|nr:epoxide hydrolase family protein [Stackebrandtia endophytica]TQL76625.1 pimeloyl-ACP methyl ester carboxylesterase [Stackebrandtia endophytica]
MISPFTIDIPQPDVDDLRRRLRDTRWPRTLPGEGWDRGVPMDYLRRIAGHWAEAFDWREAERQLNRFTQFTTEIDGDPLHFVHVRSSREDAVALLLCHGWPNSFVEFSRTIPLLTEPEDPTAPAFHVVVPSIPGFGFSALPEGTKTTVHLVAQRLVTLMDRLGYRRYGTQGGDLGAYLAPEVATIAPDRVIGVHVDGGLGFPTDDDIAEMSPSDRAEYDELTGWTSSGLDHHALLRRAPQTMSYAWADSPVGLLAWHLHKFKEFGYLTETPDEAIDLDQMLTNVSIYWFTGTEGTSSWPMYETEKSVFPLGQRTVPSGVYGGGPDLFRRYAEKYNTIVHWPQPEPVGHFIAMEQPQNHVADIRAFFEKVRLGQVMHSGRLIDHR